MKIEKLLDNKKPGGVTTPQEKKRSAPELEPHKAYLLDYYAGNWEESEGEAHATANVDQAAAGKGETVLDAPGGTCPIITFHNRGSKLGAILHIEAGNIITKNHEKYINELLEDIPFPPNSEIYCCLDFVPPDLPPDEEPIDADEYKSSASAYLEKIVKYLELKGFQNIQTVTEGSGKYVTLRSDTGKVEVLDENEEPILKNRKKKK